MKLYANTLVVIVNGDSFLKDKKGKPFMNLSERCSIVSSIKNDSTVIKTLEKIKPNFL